MITLFQSIYNRLTADATVSALVGNRIYEGLATVATFPYVTVEIDKDEPETIDGSSYQSTVTVSIEARTSGDRNDVTDAINPLLDGTSWTDQNINVISSKLNPQDNDTTSDSGNADRMIFASDLTYSMIL